MDERRRGILRRCLSEAGYGGRPEIHGEVAEKSPPQDITYYTSAGRPFPFSEFIEIEVEDRFNYTLEDVEMWKKKYGIQNEDKVIWVSRDKWIANRYNLAAEDWDKAHEIPEEELAVKEIKGSEGFIIPESDDGDEGFLFVLKNHASRGEVV